VKIYLHVFHSVLHCRLTQFQEAIAKQTDIPANQQDLVVDRGNLNEHVTPMLEAKKYPKTSDTDPMFLFFKCHPNDSVEFSTFKNQEIRK
jgi:hypothetical protein